jgi:hypothetical protein
MSWSQRDGGERSVTNLHCFGALTCAVYFLILNKSTNQTIQTPQTTAILIKRQPFCCLVQHWSSKWLTTLHTRDVRHLAVSTVRADRHTYFCKMDSSRGWTTWEFYSGQGKGVVSSPKRWERLWGPRSFLFNGRRGSFPGIKRPERPSITEVKNEWSDNSTSPIRLQGQLYIHLCCLDEASSCHSVVTFPSFWFARCSLYLAFGMLADSC